MTKITIQLLEKGTDSFKSKLDTNARFSGTENEARKGRADWQNEPR